MILGWFRALIAFVLQSLWPIQTPLAAAAAAGAAAAPPTKGIHIQPHRPTIHPFS